MAGRYSYSNSPYQADELAMYQYQYQQQAMAMQSGPRRFISAVGRFFYRLIVLTLIIGAVGGVLFALYRNDILLNVARGAGLEAQYKSLEKAIGAPGWGTPRSIDLPPESAAAASVPATADDGSDKPSETVQASANSEPKATTRDGTEIVSFDSLPTVSTKRGASTPAVAEVPAPAPEKASRPEPVKVARAEPAPVRERQQPKRKAEPAKPKELQRSIPLPKAKPEPEPVAKAEPPPKPEPAPKPEPEEDRTKPRASDNPLKAAIRASMAGKKAD